MVFNATFINVSRRGVQHYVIKFVNDLRQVGGLISLVSSTNKTDHHDITETLMKVALNTIKQTNQQTID
jgi:chromosomal replication initiation ATPase DnaA